MNSSSPAPSWGLGSTMAILLFVLGTGWAIWELFLPHATPLRSVPVTLRPDSPLPVPDLAQIKKVILKTPPAPAKPAWNPPTLSSRWQKIVVHHSATLMGNAAQFDRAHHHRHMENGLAYHFVIGNGRGAPDGKVEVGQRWVKQLDGGHVRGEENNRISIGICLVGDFEKTLPTSRQIASLKGLLNFLLARTSLTGRDVVGHMNMPGQSTVCPGTYLPVEFVTSHRQSGRARRH